MIRKPFPLGSVSTATLRTDDLLEAFSDALEAFLPTLEEDRRKEAETLLEETERALERVRPEGRELVSDPELEEDSDPELVCELSDFLSSIAPDFVYFGAHEGDGADFGFWVSWESVEEARRFGELESGDELPRRRTESGLFLVVSDHGNATLYQARAGAALVWEEVWSVV